PRAAVRYRSPAGRWQDLSWASLDARRRAVAAGLASHGVQRGDVVAFVSHNSAEMMIGELAAQTLGAAVAPIFPGYASDVLHQCLNDSGARIAMAGTAAQQHQLGSARRLEAIVVLDDRPLPDDGRALGLQALEKRGAHPAIDARSEDVAFLLYTSGTTGRPKGVELTHRNALSQQAAIEAVWDVSARDIFLSWLPWHHCFGALFERLMALWHRALLVIDDSRGRDLDVLVRNLLEVRPTVYFAVPRVYNGLTGRGEILVRGPQVMRGYRNRPVETARVIQGGWLRSGDLGEWTENGLKLLGRVDGVFKLENGEKVSAGEVEARILAATPLLEQAVVLGSGQPFVSALCWLSPAAAQRWLEERQLDAPADLAALGSVPELRRAIVEALQAANLLASSHFERVRRVALVPEVPALETGELTPTLKMVRSVSSARHAALITAMREERPHSQVLEIFSRGDPFGHA